MSRRLGALLSALALSACAATPDLAVDVRTDLVPAREFDSVRVELDGTASAPLAARAGDDFVAPRRVAEFGGLAPGPHTLEVTLLRAGASVVSREIFLRLEGSRIAVVVLTRDCRGVACPGTGDSLTDSQCLGGRCVDPSCLDGEDGCGTAECSRDDHCTSATACVEPRCVSGACLELPRAGGCGTAEVCVPDVGCVALPVGDDAGVGSDGAPPDAGACSAATCVAGPCETATCVGGVCERATLCADGEACCSGVCAPDCSVAPCAGRAAGFPCRPAAGACDVEETCDGTSAACPPDALEPGGTSCRAAVGACDVAESCSGATSDCPPDGFAPTGTACGAGSCDGLGTCASGCTPGAPCATGAPCERGMVDCSTGSLVCVAAGAAAASTVCRPAAGPCDVEETCGGAMTCPADGFLSSSTTCRESAGACDVAERCSGSSASCGSDVFDTGTCRASSGPCDVAESCTGSSATCPMNDLAPNGTPCRGSAGACDVAEVCTGASPSCPSDGFHASGTECRASAGSCDVRETCAGGPDCPGDAFVAGGTECRAAGGACDLPESCTGSAAACPGDAFRASSFTCRAAAGSCDAAETCTGSTATCPSDLTAPAGTPCGGSGYCDGGTLCCAPTCEGIVSCPPKCGSCGADFACACACCGGTLGMSCS